MNLFSAAYRLYALYAPLVRVGRLLPQRAAAGLFLFSLSLIAIAQTQTGGAIASDTVWQAAKSPYVVASDIILQSGATLTIEAGTTVYMAPETRFIVQAGTLSAVGTAAAPITITSQKLQSNQAAAGDWQQLIFNAGTGGGTRLEYVRIEYGKGLVVNGAAPTFNYLSIRNNQGAAITADLAASMTGIGNQAAGNSINAVVVPDGDIVGSVTWGLRGIPYLVLTGTVSVGASPKITSVSPNTLQQGETQTVTLSGSRLTGLSQVAFTRGGLSAQPLAGATDSQVQLQVSASLHAETGAASLAALTDAGQVAFNNALTVQDIQPKLTSVTPSVLSTNQGDATVTLKGQNFTNQSVAYLDTTALATTYGSATQLTVIVTNQASNAVKSIKIRTPNPSGGEFVSNDLPLSIITPLPVVSAMTPGDLRRGETKRFEIVGTDLGSTQISTSSASLSVSNFVAAASKVTFALNAASDAPLGKQQVFLTNITGSASISVTVNPALPAAALAPTPLAVPPDSTTHQFAVQLSYADTVSHTFSVTLGDVSVAGTSTPTLTIAAGALQAVGTIKGLKAGTTSLTLSSPDMGTLSIPVYVTADFVGLNTSNAIPVGVVLTAPPAPASQQSISPVSPNVGVVLGSAIRDMSPKAFATGSGPATLTISGVGLQGATAVSVKPMDGITLGSFSTAADGTALSVPITVAGDAPVTQRQVVVLSSAGTPYPVMSPEADRILVTLPLPQITSVDPIAAAPGGNVTMTIRGSRLQSAQSVNVSPPDGITAGSSFTVSSDGTQLSVGLAIGSNAPLGPKVITVTTPAGTSDSSAGPSNTFTVVNQLVSNVTPVASAIVGVVKPDASTPSRMQDLFSRPLGIAFGATALSISPQAKIVGDTFVLTVRGIGLQGVTAVNVVPATGLTVGAPTSAADGASLTVQVTIAADAPKTARTISLMAGTALVPFSNPAAALFNVTGALPGISSIDPIGIQIGSAPVPMTIRGQNFQNAQSVSFVPPDGMTASAPIVVDANATQLSVNVSAGSSAAPGQRAVVVTTPAGSTSIDLTAANTLTLSSNPPLSASAFAPLVGVLLQDAAANASGTLISPISAPNVGVVLPPETAPVPAATPVYANAVGVTLGPVATDVQPKDFAVSGSGTLTISGAGLDGVTAVSIAPSQGVTLGTPLQVSPDGTQASLPISIASDAATTIRTVVLSSAAGKIPFSTPSASTFGIYPDSVPQFSSISPILGTAGTLLTLTINGQNLQNATAVVAIPSDGLTLDTPPVVNANGTQLTVRIQIAPNAPLGARVIRVLTPVTASPADGSPANTLTIYAP